MGQYAGLDSFPEEIYQFEETDPVQGGPDGKDNIPLKGLADRTIWLRNNANAIGDLFLEGSGIVNLDASIVGKLITAKATGIYTLNLPDASTIKTGTKIPISSFCAAGAVVIAKPIAGQMIYDTDGNKALLNLHHKEHLCLVAFGNHFKVKYAIGNFYCAGEEVKARKVRNNTLLLNGQLVSRAQFPRLWEYVQSLTFGQEVVSEATWQSSSTNYRGCFSTGDGVTNFRLPDERGTFDRMLDLGRGLDLERSHNYPGGYEDDQLKQHAHTLKHGRVGSVDGNPNGGGWGWPPANGINEDGLVLPFGGLETRPKNIGKLNLIKF